MADTRLPVLITRAEPGASETAVRVEAIGARAIKTPVLEMQLDRDAALPESAGLSGLVFTSANGVRAFSDRSEDRALTAWCVGPATATAAQAAGFQNVQESAGNAIDLANFIADHSNPQPQPLLHIANAAAKGDLKRQLEARGFTVSFAPLYAMRPARALSDSAIQVLKSGGPCVVLIHSAKGAARFAELYDGFAQHSFHVVSISVPASAALVPLSNPQIHYATAPNEDGLFEALNAALATLSA